MDHFGRLLWKPSSHHVSNIKVYDFGDDGMDTLGGALEEDMNDFNDETFGADAVGKASS